MGTVISLASRRRVRIPARETQDQVDELRMDNVVHRAERLTFARRVGSHCRAALFALSKPQPDEQMAEHHVSQIYRLAIQEQRRAGASEPEPAAKAKAA